jgi:D-aspartate ligase
MCPPRGGNHIIIEPSVGRPPGKSALAEAGGVELLYTKYCDLLGMPLPEARRQRYSGVKWIYLHHDVRMAADSMRRGELSAREWWVSLRGRKVEAVFRRTDPIPFFRDLWDSAKRMLSKIFASSTRLPSS